MAKPKKASKITSLSHLLLVTEQNRKFAIVLGRKCYIYGFDGKEYKLRGEFPIRPRLEKGQLEIDGTILNIFNEEDRENYADGFIEILNHFIKEKTIYIDPKESLIQYKR